MLPPWPRRLGRIRQACPVVVASALALGSAPVALAAVPAGADWTPHKIRSADGTELHLDLLRPEGLAVGTKTPVILIAGPYFGGDPTVAEPPGPSDVGPYIPPWDRPLMTRAFADGYSVVLVSVRGFGASGGCTDFAGPGEQADVAAGVRWAAHAAWSTGQVGLWGLSYEGIMQVTALANRLPVAAAVVRSPYVDMYDGGYMNGVRTVRGPVADTAYTAIDASLPPAQGTDTSQQRAALLSADPRCWAVRHLEMLTQSEPDDPFWRARAFASRLEGVRVPVLTSQGFADGQVVPVGWPSLWKALGGPKHAWLGHFPHVGPDEAPNTVGRDGFLDEAMRWMDRYVKGDGRAAATVESDPAVTIQEGARGRWRSERAWPPDDAFEYRLPILPGEFVDGPGNKAEFACPRPHSECGPGVPLGVGAWTFTPSLPSQAHLSGVPRLSVELEIAAPEVTLVAQVYDFAPDGSALVISRGAFRAQAEEEVEFDLYPSDWVLEPGHRIGVVLTGGDMHFAPGTSGTVVRVRGGHLDVPLLRRARSFDLAGRPGAWIAEERVPVPFPLVDRDERTAQVAPPPPQAPR